MTDQDTAPGQRHPDGVTEAEMDAQRLSRGLGDTVDDKDVADLGLSAPETVVGGSEVPSAPLGKGGATDAGDIEDLDADQGDPDQIEDQTGTDSGSSGLQNYA